MDVEVLSASSELENRGWRLAQAKCDCGGFGPSDLSVVVQPDQRQVSRRKLQQRRKSCGCASQIKEDNARTE